MFNTVKLPHKFKIATGGCPNNCVKPDLNDIGIIGQKIPNFNSELCKGCKKCQIALACPMKAISVENGVAVTNKELCIHCGRCVGKCPFHANETGTTGFKITIGGRWGKKVAQGRPLGKIFTSEEEVLNTIEKAILLFREQGMTGERFADTIQRIGFEEVEKQLFSDEILERKQAILDAPLHIK